MQMTPRRVIHRTRPQRFLMYCPALAHYFMTAFCCCFCLLMACWRQCAKCKCFFLSQRVHSSSATGHSSYQPKLLSEGQMYKWLLLKVPLLFVHSPTGKTWILSGFIGLLPPFLCQLLKAGSLAGNDCQKVCFIGRTNRPVCLRVSCLKCYLSQGLFDWLDSCTTGLCLHCSPLTRSDWSICEDSVLFGQSWFSGISHRYKVTIHQELNVGSYVLWCLTQKKTLIIYF